MQAFCGAAAAAVGSGWIVNSPLALAAQMRRKQVLFVWLDGGMSQFESWDPKPGTRYGGPFKSIPTRIPGVHLSELMPHLADRMQHLSLVRSMHTKYEDHSRGVIPIQQGDPKNRGVTYPLLGSAVARLYAAEAGELPPYIHIKPGSGGFMYQDAGFLGAKYGALALGDGQAPRNLQSPDTNAQHAQDRERVRDQLNARFAQGRARELMDAYNHTYRVAQQLARYKHLFDSSLLLPKDLERYGSSEFGRHLLQARGLIEAGVTFVKVTMYHWDTHGDNFNCHQDGVPQVDAALAALIDDLIDRGIYQHTLLIVMSEFGRTPKINARVGRDHWPECWSVALGGGGIQTGVIVGQTNELGTFNTRNEYDAGNLFHTFFSVLGIDPAATEYDNAGQPLPIAHDDYGPIKELIA